MSTCKENESKDAVAESPQPILREEIRCDKIMAIREQSSSNRRSSLPNDLKKQLPTKDSLEMIASMKKVKSTPDAFAPLCKIAKTEKRQLHNCASHSNLPHLVNENQPRRMSCPNPCIKSILLNQKFLETNDKRRSSYPFSDHESKQNGCYLHRCKGHTSASLDGLYKDLSKPPSKSPSEPSFESHTSNKLTNRISKSIDLLDTWSSQILDNSMIKTSLSNISRENSRVSCRSSLRSIHEEHKTIL